MTHLLELCQIIDHDATKEGLAVSQGRLIDNHSCALGFDAFHNTLNGALTEVIAVALHGQTINTNRYLFLLVFISGMNNQSIADRLNAKKVPSPAARKLQSGAKLSLHFRKSDEPPWSAKAVDRILHNEVYTGKLVQGRVQ